jgi:membrane fusion protein
LWKFQAGLPLPMATEKLYREDALRAKQIGWLGEVVLLRPISFAFLSGAAAALASLVVIFMCWGSYTKRVTVSGQLIPDLGLIKVYAVQSGIVAKKNAREGQVVKQGEILYVISTERHSNGQGDVQAVISSDVAARRQSLSNERTQLLQLQRGEREILNKKIESLQYELSKLDKQIEGQKTRLRLASDTVSRYRGLVEQNYMSHQLAQQKLEDMLDQEGRLQSLERDRVSVGRELTVQKNDMSNLGFRQQNQLEQIDRSIASVGQELTESEAKRTLVIVAPESGVVTAVAAEAGQAVDVSRPLASIVPSHAQLQAHLYAPSRAIGFVRPGNTVRLRYQAYPYQQFGHAKGTVISMSLTALQGSEIAGTSSNEPMYKIIVGLDKQTVDTYGAARPLQAGMVLDADILQEKRKLYEWVLEPLYSLTGKLK